MIARTISHEARLPLLTHVDELRLRLIISVATLTLAFGFAFWQNHALLNVLNRPLAHATSGALQHSRGPLAQSARTQDALRTALNRRRFECDELADTSPREPPAQRRALALAPQADADAMAVT